MPVEALTLPGDRIDRLARRYYGGDTDALRQIVLYSNPALIWLPPVLPTGTVISVYSASEIPESWYRYGTAPAPEPGYAIDRVEPIQSSPAARAYSSGYSPGYE